MTPPAKITADAAPVRISRSDTEELRAYLSEFKGHPFLNVRTFFLPEGKAEWLPTRKGAIVRAEDIPTFVAGLYGLAKDAVGRGWCDAADLDAAMEEQEERDAAQDARAASKTKPVPGRTP
jgi:hypothetical protein